MRGKRLLAAFLLGVGLCFVPVLGHGEVRHWMNETRATLMELVLLEARVDYMMRNPDVFLDVGFYYDSTGRFAKEFPGNVDTKGKICVWVQDNKRGGYSYISGTVLLGLFKANLEILYAFIEVKGVATDMDADIVATFYSREGIPLGYFYQGEYHLWEK